MNEIVRPNHVIEHGFRYVGIYPYTLRLLSMAHSNIPTIPPPRIHALSFDEIYSQRNDLATFKVSLGRTEEDQIAYYNLLREIGDPNQVIVDKYFGGTIDENDNRSSIVSDDYPAKMPRDACHLLMWYANEHMPYGMIAHRISEFIIDRKLTAEDFLVYIKPNHSGPFMSGFSKSVTLPHVHIIIRNTQTTEEPQSV